MRGFTCAALLLLTSLLAAPVAAQNATTVTITGSRPATFARVDQVLTFNVQLYTGNTPISSLTFTSGSPTPMSGLDCPGVPADMLTTTNCTFTYKTTPMDMAMGKITALGRWTAARGSGASRSGSTNTLTVLYAPPREPDAPVIGMVAAGNSQATVAFTEPDFDGGWPVDSYTVTSSDGAVSATGTASPITVTGLTNGAEYRFEVRATNVMGTGATSAMSNSVIPTAPQTISFADPGSHDFGTAPTLTATASSGLAVSFSSATTAVCTVTEAGTLAFASAGRCTINANQAGNAAFTAAPQVSRTFTVDAVAAGAPAIGVASADDGQATVSFTPPDFTGGVAVTSYVVTSSPGDLKASGPASPITIGGLSNGTAYTFTVAAINPAGTGTGSAASNQVTPKAGQTITFNNPGTQNFGATPKLGATSSAGLPVTFSSSTAAVCTVTTSGVLTFLAAGTCTIAADQAGDPSTLAAPTRTQSFTVNAVVPGAPSIGPATAGEGEASVAFTAPAFTGGAAITGYTVAASPGGFTATGTGSPIKLTGLTDGVVYTFTVSATNAAGTGAVSAASNPVTPASSQAITFTNPGAQDFGTSPTLAAMADSGLPVAFTSASTGVCTVTGEGVLTFVTVGTCTIHADQPGSASFRAAPRVAQSFAINAVVPGAPVIGLARRLGGGAVEVSFTAPAFNGGASISAYTVVSSPDGITATGAGSPITLTGLAAGTDYTFTVVATNAAGDGAASSPSNAVSPSADQTISFDNPGPQDFGTTPTLKATSSAGLEVVFASATPAVCTVTGKGELGLLTVGTCTIHADQAGDGTYLPAPQVSQSFAINAVAPGAPTMGAVTAEGASAVSVAFAAPAFVGGAAITGYTVTSHPGGITATGTGSPITVNGLSAGTAYTFTVVASNSAGPGSASTPSDPVTPVPELLAADSTLSVAYGAGATAVDLDITGAASSVAIASAPLHGVVAISGSAVTYQPHAGYAGADSFSYTASDAYTTTAPATVTVSVAAPMVVLDSTAPLDATGSASYTHVFTASGGAAPYTFSLVSGTLPDGLALGPDGTLSGTPAQDGSYAFTVEATDSSIGTGPFSVRQNYTLEIKAPAIELQLSLPDMVFGAEVQQALQASGGTAPYTFAIAGGALPRGLTLSTAGLMSGTPQQAGRFSATIQASDANGFTAQQAVELLIAQAAQAITGFVANPAAPVFTPGGTFALSAQGGASGKPVVFASATPAVCTVEGDTVTMRAAGGCSLTADQAGDANHSAAPQATLDVDIAAAVPTLVWPEQLSKVLGEPAFDLDNPESDSAGAFTFTSSQPGVASISGRRVTLHTQGSTVITAMQAANGNYAAASIEMQLVVVERPDPTRDPGVTGLLQAQVDASVRFAAAQQSNIRDRLRQVRSGPGTSSTNLTLAYAGGDPAQGLSMPLGGAADAAWPAMPQGWGAWLSGTATFGSSGRSQSFDFETDGITLGVDRAVGDNLLVGMAGSLATNTSELDHSDSRLDADQHSLALYGLWRAGGHVFVDGMVGTGQLDFDIRRWSEDANAVGTAARDGHQWFASMSMGYEHQGRSMTLTGYGRVDTSRTTLDGYREFGLDIYDLEYREQVVDNSTAALGLEGRWNAGRVRPFWSVEYREALENKGEAAMNYVVWPNATDYRLRMGSYNDHALSLSAGLDLELRRGWLLSLLLGHEQGRNATDAGSVGLRLSFGAQPAAIDPVVPDDDSLSGAPLGACLDAGCRRQTGR